MPLDTQKPHFLLLYTKSANKAVDACTFEAEATQGTPTLES